MILDAVPAGETGHDGQRARVDCGGIALRMGADQLGFGNLGVALVLAILRPAIGQKMFGSGGDAQGPERFAWHQLSLKPVHHGGGIGFHEGGIGGIAFIAAAPAQILRHGERGREGPFDPGPGDFGGGRLADAVNKVGIMGRAKADIVRKDGRARHIAVAMHGVHAKEDGDARARLERGGAIVADHPGPGGGVGPFIAIGAAIAAGEDGAERVARKVGWRDGTDVALHNLPDLLFDGHAGEKRIDRPFGGRVGDGCGAMRLWPSGRIGAGGGGHHGRLLRGCRAGKRKCAGEEQGGEAHGHPS